MYKLLIVEAKTVSENDKEALKRMSSKQVGYMEISAEAKGFACGACRSINTEGFCQNPEVKGYVSAKHGCCNHFYPKAGNITFPKK